MPSLCMFSFFRGMVHPPVYSATALSFALTGDITTAREYIELVNTALNADQQDSFHNKRSVPLFIKLRNQEVERECTRVEDYIARLQQNEGTDPQIVTL